MNRLDTLPRILLIALPCTLAASSPARHAAAAPQTAAGAAEPASRPHAATAPAAQPAFLPALIPRPREIHPSPGAFRLTEQTAILIRSMHPEIDAVAGYLADWLRRRTGLPVPVRRLQPGDDSAGHIVLVTSGSHDLGGIEGYQLSISRRGIGVFAANPRGLFYAVQTLRQLAPPEPPAPPAFAPTGAPPAASAPAGGTLEFPAVRIADFPRFRWRGLLLDCVRHYLPKDLIFRYIDLLAEHKMNVLHWHLTDDQGWRIEIRRHPRLTGIGAWRPATRDSEQPRDPHGRYGGFYSQQDIREIVEYARSRYVTIVPGIGLPGHCQAALAAYPQLGCTGGPFEVSTAWGVHADVFCAGSDQVLEFLESVLDEVCELFPGEYVHVGGAEVPGSRWQACPRCQRRIRDEGLRDAAGLQAWFLRRIQKFLASRKRKLLGWDEILADSPPASATIQVRRSMEAAVAATRAGHDVICSPTSHCCLDCPQGPEASDPAWTGVTDLARALSFEPVPAGLASEQARHILGVEGILWTEHVPPERVDWQVFPRLCALAEVAWSPPAGRDPPDFTRRMRAHYRRLDALGVRYYIPPPQSATELEAFTDSAEFAFRPLPLDAEIRYTIDQTPPTAAALRYDAPLRVSHSTVIRARTVLPDGRASDTATFHLRALRPLEPVDAAGAEPGLRYEYFEGQWHGLPDFAALKPKKTGFVTRPDLSVRDREIEFALRFTGLIEVPADGEYVFHMKCDDGGRLLIHDEQIVDNDGVHPALERRGRVLLKAGRHPITIEYFQARGNTALIVSYEGPGIERQRLPAGVLSAVREHGGGAAVQRAPTDGGQPETTRAVPRAEPWWRQRFEELNCRARLPGARMIFLGDSITQGWEEAGREVWERYYAPRGAVNLGISGDRTQHVLWRLRNGHLDALAARPDGGPELAVVMIGTNNSNADEHSAEEIAAGICAIVQELRARLPQTRVLLLAIFPRGAQPDAQRVKNATASRLAAQAVADGQWVRFLDIGERFLDAEGRLSAEIMPDYLHLSARGYAIWAEAMEASVAALLGE